MDWQSPLISFVGLTCAKNWMNCPGDTQDTVYQVSGAEAMDLGEFYAGMGPLGKETGNA